MDYANLIKMLMGGASGGASGSNPLSEITEAKSPAIPTTSPSSSPASDASGMLSKLIGGGKSKEKESNPNMEMIKAAATPIIGGSSDEYMAKMNALRNMRNR